MLKYASKLLPDDYEYGIVWWGQSNATPNGTQTAGLAEEPQLVMGSIGLDVTVTVVTGSGNGEVLTVTSPVALTANIWVGAELRMGRPTSPLVGYGTVTANGTGTLTVNWTKASATGSQNAYLVFRNGKHRKYENVRVLHPFLPDQAGANPAGDPVVPGYSVPATITDYDDLGLFLEFTFLEGRYGYGLNESTEVASAVDANTLTLNSTALTAGVFAGGYLRVRHDNGISGSAIGDNTNQVFSGLTWTGDGTPTGTPSTWTWEAWLPHYLSHPHEGSAGPGFLYPSNESQPQGAVYSRPSGNTTATYTAGGYLWGAILPYASRLADALGKRIHIIPLAIDSASLVQNRSLLGGPTEIGWWDVDVRGDFNPSTANGLAARLLSMITTMAPAALTAEGNTKPLRIIGIGPGFQGETEATSEANRDQYKYVLPTFYDWLKQEIFDAGLSFYASAAKMPVLHPGIRETPWEDTGANADTDGIVNSAITNYTSKVEFAATIDVNDSPITGNHFNAVGESLNGKLCAEEMLKQIDEALSSEEDLDDPVAIEICNVALAYIGDVAKITSLDVTVDTSTQAYYCAKFYTQAREMLLQRLAWSFATRRAPLLAVDDARTAEWACAYGVPNNAVRVFAVLPPEAGADYSSGLTGTATVFTNSDGALVTRSVGTYIPRPFTVEQDADGHKIIYTDTEDAVGRYNVRVADASQYPPLFKNALSLKLAAMLTGPLMQGEDGIRARVAMERLVEEELSKAETQDSFQHDVKPEHIPPTIRARR